MNLRTIDKFHKTRVGYLVFGLVELAAAAVFINWALGSGDWWQWLLTAILLFGALQNLVRSVVAHKR
jgi:hypothetical protein